MGRTAAPATPGTDPNAAPVNAGIDTKDAAAAPAAPADVTLTDALQMIAELKSQMQTLGRNQLAHSMPEKVDLPELASIMKQKPDIPVLTRDGWYVPAVLPQQRAG